MRRTAVFFVLCVAFLASCSPVKHLDIENISISEFRMESSTKANVTLAFSVDNLAQFPVSLSYTEATIKKDMELFATVALKDTAVAPPMTRSVVKVPVEITLCDPMSLLSMGLNIKSWDINDFTVTGKMTFIGNNGARKSYKVKETQLSTLLERLKR